MDHAKAAGFWQTVLEHSDALRAPLSCDPEDAGWDHVVDQVTAAMEALNAAVREVDERLGVEAAQAPVPDGSLIQLAVTCGCNAETIDAVLALVAAAPALPAGLTVCAFKPPVPAEVISGFGTMQFAGQEVAFDAVRFIARPSEDEAGKYDVVCFAPNEAQTPFDEGVPGSMAVQMVLGMGIGELKLMTRIGQIGVELTDEPPAVAVTSWELNELMERTSLH
jgi:hypothetical protein